MRTTTKEQVQSNSTQALKADIIVLLPIYMGRRTSIITIKIIPPETDENDIAGEMTLELNDKMKI